MKVNKKNIADIAAKALSKHSSITAIKNAKTEIIEQFKLTEQEYRETIATAKALRLEQIAVAATTATHAINYDSILSAAFAIVAKDKAFKSLCLLAAQKYTNASEFIAAYYPFFDEEKEAPLHAVKFCDINNEIVYTRLELIPKTPASALSIIKKSLQMFAVDLKAGIRKDAGSTKFAAWSWSNKYSAMQIIAANHCYINIETREITCTNEPAPLVDALPENILSLSEARKFLQTKINK